MSNNEKLDKMVEDLEKQADIAKISLGLDDPLVNVTALLVALKRAYDDQEWERANYIQNQIIINQNTLISKQLEKLLKK